MRTSICFTVCVLLCSTAFAQQTEWLGTLKVGAVKLRIKLVTEGSKSASEGELFSLDQGNARIPLNSISLKDGSLTFKSTGPGITYSGKQSEDGKTIEGTFSQAGQKFPLTFKQVDGVAADKLVEAWVGTLVAGPRKLRLQFRILEQDGGKRVTMFDSLNENALGIPAESKVADGTLTFEVKRLNAKFEGKLSTDGKKAEGEWNQGTPLPMTFEKLDKAEGTPKRNRPQTPKPPFPYDAKDVNFDSTAADVKLAGTLTTPKGAGPFPAVVLVSGSGPQDRDETIFEHKPFLVIADHLTRNGIAVLRYDDRGVGKSTGSAATGTTADFAQDAAGAVRYLRTLKNINAKEIGIAGHSEGGIIAPIVAADDPELGFIILLSGPGVSGREIIAEQSMRLSKAAGVPTEAIETNSKVRNAVMDAVLKAPADSDWGKVIKSALSDVAEQVPEEHRSAITTEQSVAQMGRLASPWMRYFLKHDPLPVLKRVKCPVLALTGNLDLQVWHEQNVPVLKAALEEAGNKHSRVKVYPKLNHLFQKATTGTVTEYLEIETTFEVEVLDEMTDWIRLVVTP